MFGKLRLIFNVSSQHKDQRPTELPLEIEVDGEPQTIMVSIPDYPAMPIAFPVLPPPGILRGEPPTSKFSNIKTLPVVPIVNDNDARLARLRARIGRPAKIKVSAQTPIDPFVRLLAKIAHSTAVAEYGLGSFEPLLPDIILNRSQFSPHFVGGIETTPVMQKPQFADGAHRIFYALTEVEVRISSETKESVIREHYLTAAIRIFKDLGSPTYFVVIGIPGPQLTRDLRDSAILFPQDQ